MSERAQPVKLSDDEKKVVILDQTLLPNQVKYLSLTEEEDFYEALKLLRVRGAPCIGVFAAYAMYVLSIPYAFDNYGCFKERFHKQVEGLNACRPTAVNLAWALKEMMKVVDEHPSTPVNRIVELLKEKSRAIDADNTAMTERIAVNGLSLLHEGDGILTHCNAGALACMGYGTATAPLFLAKEKGMNLHVYADETRPLLQGARLTSYELSKAGIDVTLICDNMAATVMKQGKIQAVMVGCDRIAANGDFANKIGTAGLSVLAKHFHIPMYTLGPFSTIDFDTPDGDHIVIEERDQDEIKTMWYKEPMALPEVKCYNPAFDVTDHELLGAIVTERGIVYPPFDINLKRMYEGD